LQKVIFYTKDNCLLCDEAYSLVEVLSYDYPFEVEKIDIYSDDALLEKYHLLIPVVKINGRELVGEELTFEKIESEIRKVCN